MEFIIQSDILRAGSRFLIPVLALWILYRCCMGLLAFRREPEVWAWLCMPNGARLPVTHWENTVGRGRLCDVSVQYPTVSRLHAVLTRSDRGEWTITDAGSKSGVKVSGQPVESAVVPYGELIELGGVEFTLLPITKEQERLQAGYRTRAGSVRRPAVTLAGLSLFQLVLLANMLSLVPLWNAAIPVGALLAMEWGLYGFYRLIRRSGFELETAAFFLCSLCLSMAAVSDPSDLYKLAASIAGGVVLFLAVGWSLRNLARAKFVRYLAAAAGIALLLASLIFGREINGARNWIFLFGLSVQPSELAKVCFVYVGASTLDRLVTKRNITLFLIYTAAICLCLALISDFGTALVFFTAFLVIAFLRSGNFAALALSCGGVAFAGAIAARFLPYISRRASAWGHVWENPLTTGYQQTRAMMCMASGGLFGLGIGKGWLHYVAAADTDLVFAFLGEEYGLILAVTAVLFVVMMAAFVFRAASQSRSGFYTIGACAAVSILVIQTIFNVLGTVDLLPLTGVTFPFLSNGGSGMIAAWGLLAFLKSADTRQNASFTIRLPEKEAAT